MLARREGYWHEETVARERRQIKGELDQAAGDGEHAQLSLALGRIRELQDSTDSRSRLRCYIFAVAALAHHERDRGLTAPQVRRLSALALSMLKLQGITPGYKKTARLYADVYTVMSQIHRREGEQWAAAWQQNLAAHVARGAHGRRGFHGLATAMRSFRLGDARLAIKLFNEAIVAGLPPALETRAWFVGSPGTELEFAL